MSSVLIQHPSASSRRKSGMIFGMRFDGRETPILHARRASAEYIRCSVGVRMVRETARSTGKASLAFAASLIDGSAGRTPLGSMGGADLDEQAAALFEFVGQNTLKGVPALFEDAPIEIALAGASARHVGRSKPFNGHQAEALSDVGRSLVPPVTSDARNLRRDAGYSMALFDVAARSSLAPRKDALCLPFAAIQCGHAGNAHHLASGECKRVGNTSINADCGKAAWLRLMLNVASEADEPPASILGERNAHHAPLDRASVPELNPAKVRHPDSRPLGIEPSNGNRRAWAAEAVVDALPTRRWKLGAPAKEAIESLVQVAQDLAEGHRRGRSDPINLAPELGYLPPLTDEVETAARLRPELSPEVTPLGQGEIIDEPRNARELTKRFGLLGSRLHPVAKSAMNHRLFLAETKAEGHP